MGNYTPKDSMKETLEHYRELILFYQKEIRHIKEKLKGDLSERRKQCYEGLLEVSEVELKKCRQRRNQILTGKE